MYGDNKKSNKYKGYSIIKGFALLLPVLLSIVLLLLVVKRMYIDNLYGVALLDTKINAGISIIGIAITMWVGLNIYNLVERKEVDDIKVLYNDLVDLMNTQNEKLELNELHSNWYDIYNLALTFLQFDFYSINDKVNSVFLGDEQFKEYEKELVSRIEGAITAFQEKEKNLKKGYVGWYFKQIEILCLFLDKSLEYHCKKYKQEELMPIIYNILREINRVLNKNVDLLKSDFKILKECKTLFEIYDVIYNMLTNINNNYEDVFEENPSLKDLITKAYTRIEEFKVIERD